MNSAAEQLPAWLKALYPFQSFSVQQPGGTQHVALVGPEDGEPVVMLHGNPTWSFYYRGLAAAAAAEGLRVIVPDHLGCGLSQKPSDWSYRLADHVENAVRVVESLIRGRFSLVVHDWGGAIGMGVATRMPERIARMVILNTGAFHGGRMPGRIAVCRAPLVGEFLVRGLNGFAGPAAKMTTARPMPSDVRRAYQWPYRSWRDRVAVARFVQDIPMRPGHPTFETISGIQARLYSLKDKPVRVVWGGRDWCFNRWFYEEWLRRFPSAERAWLDDAGHYVLEDGGPPMHADVARWLAV